MGIPMGTPTSGIPRDILVRIPILMYSRGSGHAGGAAAAGDRDLPRAEAAARHGAGAPIGVSRRLIVRLLAHL